MTHRPLPQQDLAQVLEQARPAFADLKSAQLFITGGTGFFGHWLLESLLYADRELGLSVHATVLTRDAAAFRARSPHLAHAPAITLLEGDLRELGGRLPAGTFTHIVHAATDSGGRQTQQTPAELAESIIHGTEQVLALARPSGARLLYTSTGAVYGRSTPLPSTPETYLEQARPVLAEPSYEAAKLRSEALCVAAADAVIARCFAFVGPHLPLDRHFAIGNFVGAALAGQPIAIRGDGTPRRSWMYMSDLAVWLWTLLAQGRSGQAYNVGSDRGMTIAEAAHLTAATLAPGLGVEIASKPTAGAPLNSYVPDITRAREELGLHVSVELPEALRRTAAWHRAATAP